MKYDVLIVGGGIVGLTLALALAQKTSLTIALLESRKENDIWSPDKISKRVSAITLASQRIFQNLGIWEDMKSNRVSPFSSIEVWHAAGGKKLQFESSSIAENVLGYIVENNLIQTLLAEKIKQYSQITYVSPISPHSFLLNENAVELFADEERHFQGKLIVGADGANSWVRKIAEIEANKVNYEEKAIIATVSTTIPHGQVARQVFHQKSILAFLPLAYSNQCSIVWSLANDQLEQIQKLDEIQFKNELGKAFNFCLGEIKDVQDQALFPLFKQQTKNYIKNRLALVGDAAHTVHPLAGQGVNMGLLDAAALFDVINASHQKHHDIGHMTYLRRYERFRRADHFALMHGLDIIKNLYKSEHQLLQLFRESGLKLTNQMQWLKNQFIHHAVGNRRKLPSLAKHRKM